MAVERVFVNVNPNSTLLLGQARGAAIAAAVLAGLPVTEYTAGQVKQAVVGGGRAAKTQVQAMVMRLLALPGAPQSDAADALATAICHAHASTGVGALGTGRRADAAAQDAGMSASAALSPRPSPARPLSPLATRRSRAHAPRRRDLRHGRADARHRAARRARVARRGALRVGIPFDAAVTPLLVGRTFAIAER